MKLAVISTSRIVKEFLEHVSEMREVEPALLCCRPQSRDRAEKLAAAAGVPEILCDEAVLFRRHDYDAVYIGTANHLHYDTARRALEAGHSVILEKPFTATAAQARELYEIAHRKGVFLLEAITTPYLPAYRFLQEGMRQIGPICGAMANFSARSSRYEAYVSHRPTTTFDPACLGGALNDMNIYNLHLLWGLLGKPCGYEYRQICGYNGVDVSGMAILQYQGFTAVSMSAKDSGSVNGCLIQGRSGYLVLQGDPNSMVGVARCVADGVSSEAPQTLRHRMCYEFEEFGRILAGQDAAVAAAAERQTLAVMDMLDNLHQHMVNGS
jgi:predicted dehydrogenase